MSSYNLIIRKLTYLQDSNRIQQYFSAEKQPTLWRALPAIEGLQTTWEAKHNKRLFAKYWDAIADGLSKINKYYSRFDEKLAFILDLSKFSSFPIMPVSTYHYSSSPL